jgi:diaminohydroxyphosphoribosylaminopyrimidine deaminase/5-amino-6-(5-phosphoribosylamino)uracil reductase
MQRCLQLAALAAGYVAPNPMVGSVLVYEDRIIGEGYHQQYGAAHAEVNCINNVAAEDKHLVPASTIYVSLEPCAHFGKTPPCADLIISQGIKKVVVGCRDPFEEVNGKGIEKLQQAAVEVIVGVLEDECIDLNKRFFCFHTKRRPYIILKWAQSDDGFIAAGSDAVEESDTTMLNRESTVGANIHKRTFISNAYTNRLVHKWRSEEASILVGTNTALLDNPSLTTRWWTGKNPVRVVVDKKLVLPAGLQLFDRDVATIVFNEEKDEEHTSLLYKKMQTDKNDLVQMMQSLYELKINSVLVEGGASLLQSFISQGLWDEARVISNHSLQLKQGLKAPVLQNAFKVKETHCADDKISLWKHGNQIL